MANARKAAGAADKAQSGAAKGQDAKRTGEKRPAAKRPAAKQADVDRRWSILLFGLGLLLVVLALVSGESGWAWLRSWVLFGSFGLSGWLLGPLVIYWAVLVSMGRPVFAAIIKGVLLLLAVCGAALVFSGIDLSGLSFGEVLAALMENGRSGYGGGLLSGVLGAGLLALAGAVGARIMMVLVVLVALMVVAGVSPADIVHFFAGLGRRARRYEEEAGERASEADEAGGQAARGPQELEWAGRGKSSRQAVPGMAQPTNGRRGAAVADVALSGNEAARRTGGRARRAALDIDLGPDAAPAPGGAERVNAAIGPGGSFGLSGAVRGTAGESVTEQFGLGDYEPLVPFDPVSPQPLGRRAEEVLLFGEHDPYAPLGGAASRLPRGVLPDVEYIAPEPADEPEFDLFGRPAPLPDAWGEGSGGAEGPRQALCEAQNCRACALRNRTQSGACEQLERVERAKRGWAEGPRQAAEPIDPRIVGARQAAEAAFEQPAVLPDATGGALTADVGAMIEKAAAHKTQEKVLRGEDRGSGDWEQAYSFPPVALFTVPPTETSTGAVEERKAREEMTRTADLLVGTLASFGVQTRILDISRGPSVTRYEIQPQAGVKISRITGLADDIALNLAAAGVRIEAPIPGKPAVGIEVPNKVKSAVVIRSIFESEAFAAAETPLPMALGKDIAGDVVVADLTRMPHLLIAGSTGSGKSVCVNAIIMSFLYRSSPEDVRLILIDPKVVELAEYNGIPHLLIPVVTEPRQAAKALGHAVAMMERRYRSFAENNVRDIKSYNRLAERDGSLEHMPHIAIIIDELADLMMTAGKDVENFICRIAQKARAAGMHLIVATQRPSVDVITGLIKSNIPSRIAFAVSSQVDSRTILDGAGAEKLLGMGDMLFMPIGASKPVRIQGTYVRDSEISKVLRYVKENSSAAYDEDVLAEMENVQLSGAAADRDNEELDEGNLLSDATFVSAVEMALDAGEISTSGLQRRLRLGYARAGRIVDQMERLHIVSEPNGSKPRQLLISRSQWQEMVMNSTE